MLVQCWTNTWLWSDQHLRRRPSINPTRAYCNVLRFLGSQSSSGLTIVSALNKGKNQCWPNMASVTDVVSTLEQHRVGTTNLWSLYTASQQTRDIVPMLVQCWFTVYDAGPTLNRQWDNVSCLLGLMNLPRLFVSHMEEMNVLCNIRVPANTTHWSNVGPP